VPLPLPLVYVDYPKHLLLIKVITTNICVKRMVMGGEYRKVVGRGNVTA
jgi:hypothetical protein